MNGPSQPLDAYQLVASLTGHRVDFVVIGGVALQAHGHVRTTVDLDVVAAWTPENVRRLAGALRELEAKPRGVDATYSASTSATRSRSTTAGTSGCTPATATSTYSPSTRPWARRLATRICGARAIAVKIRGVTLLIAHPDDLIRMKTAASQFRDRPTPKRRQDLDDIAVLEQLRGGSAPPADQATES